MKAGAERIELFFSQPHDVGEKIEFLKREYGTGGAHGPAFRTHGTAENGTIQRAYSFARMVVRM